MSKLEVAAIEFVRCRKRLARATNALSEAAGAPTYVVDERRAEYVEASTRFSRHEAILVELVEDHLDRGGL